MISENFWDTEDLSNKDIKKCVTDYLLKSLLNSDIEEL